MKKSIIAVFASLLMFNGITDKLTESAGEVYSDLLLVTDVTVKTDTVTCINSEGNLYEFTGIENYVTGDYVTITFNDNGSRTVTDDVILYVSPVHPERLGK